MLGSAALTRRWRSRRRSDTLEQLTGKKMTKQLTGKRDDTAMHAAARVSKLGSMRR